MRTWPFGYLCARGHHLTLGSLDVVAYPRAAGLGDADLAALDFGLAK